MEDFNCPFCDSSNCTQIWKDYTHPSEDTFHCNRCNKSFNRLIIKFKAMVQSHNLTYMLSGDHSVYMKGHKRECEIKKMGFHIGDDIAGPIWDDMIDRTIKFNKERWYWKSASK